MKLIEKYDRALIHDLVNTGVLPYNYLFNMDVYLLYNYFMGLGFDQEEAIAKTKTRVRCSLNHVLKVIRDFEREVEA